MYKIPLLWIFIAPIAAAMTIDDIPNVRRSLVMLPMVEMISAFGFLYVLQNKKKLIRTLIIFSVTILLVCNFLYFTHQYFIHAPIHRNWYRNEGFDEMVKTINNSYNNIDKVVLTKSLGGIYPLILFYTKYDPKTYLLEGAIKDRDYTGFGKFFFVPQDCPYQQKGNRFLTVKKIIYVDNGVCEDNAKNQKTIYRKDGSKVFNIVYE